MARADRELKGDSAVRDVLHLADSGHLYAAHVINDLWIYTEGKALVVTDVGQHQMWEAQYYKHDYPRKLITSGGLGTMGFALPAAIGAKMAKPDEEVVAIVGDGGIQMTAAEFSTCAQEEVKVNVAIINNGYLGLVRQWQESSTVEGTARHPCVTLTSSSSPRLMVWRGCAWNDARKSRMPSSKPGRSPARWSSISKWRRKTPSSPWSRPEPI